MCGHRECDTDQSFAAGRPYIAPGEAAAEAALPEITALLPWLRPAKP